MFELGYQTETVSIYNLMQAVFCDNAQKTWQIE